MQLLPKDFSDQRHAWIDGFLEYPPETTKTQEKFGTTTSRPDATKFRAVSAHDGACVSLNVASNPGSAPHSSVRRWAEPNSMTSMGATEHDNT
jgi:hypothetical protein